MYMDEEGSMFKVIVGMVVAFMLLVTACTPRDNQPAAEEFYKSRIVRVDLGDTTCYIYTGTNSMSCVR